MAAVRLGAIFGAVMFAAGFLLGTIRTILLLPWLGEVGAVLVELPVMLVVAWAVAGRLIARAPRPSVSAALGAGAVALAVLWALELAMVVVLFGVPLAEAPAAFLTPGSRIGLISQAVTALFPALQRIRKS